MPHQVVRVDEAGDELTARFRAIREELGVPVAFPDDVDAEATRVASAPLGLPTRDETAVQFLTIDPPGSMDLDQALHIERHGDGYRVRYAITYLAAFVTPGGAVDTEARLRGQTIYAPDERTPLHPTVLSEGAASLLPDVDRPAYVWDLVLDASGEVTTTSVYAAMVRSRLRLDYQEVQRALDAGKADERLVLLREVGERRVALEQARGGASLPVPDQEVSRDSGGTYRLEFRPLVPAEDWNAQISLMTGMAAAELMVAGGVGILRTMPPADGRAVARFRRQAAALGVPWPEGELYGAFLRRLDRTDPAHLALIYEATGLFRGAAYTPFEGQVPPQAEHSALAARYAHVTAPLRRLVDRFGLAVCAALSAGEPVPEWVRAALPDLPKAMQVSDRLAGAVNRASTDATEAAVLSDRVGEAFESVVVDRDQKGAQIQITEPAVLARAQGPGAVGSAATARLNAADVSTGTVRFQLQR